MNPQTQAILEWAAFGAAIISISACIVLIYKIFRVSREDWVWNHTSHTTFEQPHEKEP